MLIEHPDRPVCLPGVELLPLHQDHHQIGPADREQHDLGRRPFKIDDDKGSLCRCFLDPVKNIVLVDIPDDPQIVGQGPEAIGLLG